MSESTQSRRFAKLNFGDASQRNVYSVSQSGTVFANIQEERNQISEVKSPIEIDREVANLLNWLAEQQGISPEIALKKAVALAAYIHDITTSQGGKLLVQHKDNSIGEIVLK